MIGILNDRLTIYCFSPAQKKIHIDGVLTFTGEGLHNLGLCSALRAFEQRGSFIVPQPLWQVTWIFLGASVLSEGSPHSVGSAKDLTDSQQVEVSHDIQTTLL
jgi:hypothetical protein